MLEPIYYSFNFIIWSFSALLWLIWYLFIIIAIITFIGFINVQFFTKNNAEFSKILKDEQNSSLRFQLNNKQNSSSSNESDQDSDDMDAISNPSSYSSRSNRRRHRLRKPKQQLPADMEPTWTMSKRMKTKERRRYREESPPSQSSPSESIHSISASVSNSVSQYKSLHNTNKPPINGGGGVYDDDNIDTLLTSDITQQSLPRSVNSMLSPDINQYESAQFKFKLTQRMRRRRKEEQMNMNQIDSTSQTDDVELSRSGEDNEDIMDIEDDNDNDNNKEIIIEFDINRMKCFDNIYDYMEGLVLNEVKIEESVRSEIQSFIESGTLKFKSFEKALLVQKLLEL